MMSEESKITTVLGEITKTQMGYCQPHEHLFIKKGIPYSVNSQLWMEDYDLASKALKDYALSGGRAIVDAQPAGCGRMEEELTNLARETGIHIIAVTGFHKGIFYPKGHWQHVWQEEQLSGFYVSELTEGMYNGCDEKVPGKQIKSCAGLIKASLQVKSGKQDYVRMRAAARAQYETGKSMMIHVDPGSDVLSLCDYLSRLGIKAKRMIFCHLDRACPDIRTHVELCKRGAFLEYDTIGRDKYHSDSREIEIIKSMLTAGFGEQLMLSLDMTRERFREYGSKIGLTYLLKQFLPLARQEGISANEVNTMTVKNPARALAGE